MILNLERVYPHITTIFNIISFGATILTTNQLSNAHAHHLILRKKIEETESNLTLLTDSNSAFFF